MCIRMANNLEPSTPHQWHNPKYVDTWLASKSMQNQPFQEKLVSQLPFRPGKVIRVLDIGTGNGSLGLEVLHVYPKAQLVCHDFSEVMLNRAKQQLIQFSEQLTFIKSDLRNPTWTYDIVGTFDAVVSSSAIHNVVVGPPKGSVERIKQIYFEIFNLIKPKGCFLNYDIVGAAGSISKQIYLKKTANFKPEDDMGALDQQGMDILNHLDWLKQVGFDEVDCLWKEHKRAIFGGFKH